MYARVLAILFSIFLVLLPLSSTALAASEITLGVSPDTFYVYPAGAQLEPGRTIRIPSSSDYSFGQGGSKASVFFDYDARLKGECAKSIFSYPLTSSFGDRLHPIRRKILPHLGIDLGLREGTNVCAIRGGTVVRASSDQGGFGTQVVIEASDGSCDSYNHLSAYGVREGDAIAAGSLIAKSGSTGLSTGPHLHFGRSSKCVFGGRYALSKKYFVDPLKFANDYRYA